MKQIEYLENLAINEFFTYFNKLNSNEVINLINNPYLKYLNEEKFNLLFFRLNKEQATILLSNEVLYDKVMNLPNNKNNKNVFEILIQSKMPILKLIIESEYIIKYKDKLFNYILSCKVETLNKLFESISFDKFNYMFSNKDELYKYICKKFGNVDIDIFEIFYTGINNKSLDFLKLIKINNYKEFILYTKFGVLIEVDNDLSEITLKNGLVLPIDEIINCKNKYILKLMNLLKQKGNAKEEEIFIASLKLYYIFGYDNARKIIENKFSKMTIAALERLNNFDYKDARREYRARHQQKFYHYQMIDEIINSVNSDETIVFENLLYEPNEEKIQNLKKEFKEICDVYSGEELKLKIKNKIAEEIVKRENSYKLRRRNKLNDMEFEEPDITAKYICELLKSVDIKKVIGYDEVLINKLRNVLLGNTRNNNDCLFRMILNRSALGLEENLATIINEFQSIDAVITKSGLSFNSPLDIIDVLKVKLFELRPNETDIYLSSISRLVNAVEFRERSDVNIAKETCMLHVERKKKVYATIPTVKGQTEHYTYEVAPFDAEYLLTAGLDAKNCFRISGLGEDFFRYCLTNPNAVVVYLKDKKGKKHICPIIRTGNAICCNGIDPEVEDEYKKDALDALSKCYCDMMNITKESEEPIEVATLTNLHMKEFFNKYRYPFYISKHGIPLENCYTDFNKKETKNYILAKSTNYTENKFYSPNIVYYQNRNENYEYDTNEEFDYERISQIVNSIAYTSIDYSPKTQKEKNAEKRHFKPFDTKTFKYIIGNKDWFIAIDEQLNTIGKLLPYDPRARIDYINAYGKAMQILEKIMGEKNDRHYI